MFHAVETTEKQGQTGTREVWLDLENDIARVNDGGQLRIFHDGKIADLNGKGRLTDADIENSSLDRTSAVALSHFSVLFLGPTESGDVQIVNENGRSVYRVEATKEWHGDETGTQRFEIYLDEDFFPIWAASRVEGTASENMEQVTEVRWDFIPRSNLPAGFISIGALQALVVTLLDDIANATKTGLKPYWAGESFEGLTLKDAGPDAGVSLILSYLAEGGSPGITIEEYTQEAWVQGRKHVCDWSEMTRTNVPLLGTTAALCEMDGKYIGLDGDRYLELVVPLDGAILVVIPLIGDAGTNPYRNPESLLRFASSIRPFEQAPTP